MQTLSIPYRPTRSTLRYVYIVPVICAAMMMLPLIYIVIRASQADTITLEYIFSKRTLGLLQNTLLLTAGVLVTVTTLAVPMAWIVTRCAISARRVWTLAAIMPLAIPGYLMAYALLAVGGENGTAARLFGLNMPRPSGYWGALAALTAYNLPYMFLNVRVAMQRMDPALEETARSLGHSPMSVLRRVILPQLRPSILAGGLLVGLHVIGDFGVVSLLRYETFSQQLYTAVDSGQLTTAAWYGLMLVAITLIALVCQWRLLRGLRFDPAGMSVTRRRPIKLGAWAPAAYLFLGTIVVCSLVVPLTTIFFWLMQGSDSEGQGSKWAAALGDSLTAAIPAAMLTSLIAMPFAYLAVRYPSRRSRAIESTAYLGYATPSLAFALGIVFFAMWFERMTDGWSLIPTVYQTLGLLVAAYALHFMAEAVGPIRTALLIATPRIEEASRSLGHGRIATFFKVTLPLLRPGIIASMALVFLSVMKELPITYILSPYGFGTLSWRVWDYTNESLFAEAAPYALTILLLSAAFVGLLLTRGTESRPE